MRSFMSVGSWTQQDPRDRETQNDGGDLKEHLSARSRWAAANSPSSGRDRGITGRHNTTRIRALQSALQSMFSYPGFDELSPSHLPMVKLRGHCQLSVGRPLCSSRIWALDALA